MYIKTEHEAQQGGLEPRIKTCGCTLTASWTGVTTQRLSTGRKSDASTSCSDSDPSSRLLKSYYQVVVASTWFFNIVCWGGGVKTKEQHTSSPVQKKKHLGDSSVPTAVSSRLFLMFSTLITQFMHFILYLFLLSHLFHYSICANKIFPPVVFYSVLSFADDDALGSCWKDLQIKNFCKGFWQKLLWEVWHRSLVYIQASIIKGHSRVGGKKAILVAWLCFRCWLHLFTLIILLFWSAL